MCQITKLNFFTIGLRVRYSGLSHFLKYGRILNFGWLWSGLESSTASMLMTSSMMAGNNGAIIEEWSQCVKSMGVSSRESWAYRLTDGTSSYWQSCGTQGKHWIRLEMNPDVLIHSLRVQVIFVDFSIWKDIWKKSVDNIFTFFFDSMSNSGNILFNQFSIMLIFREIIPITYDIFGVTSKPLGHWYGFNFMWTIYIWIGIKIINNAQISKNLSWSIIVR